jgi:hypothetical protein
MIPANHSSGCTADVPTESQQSRGRCEYVAARRALKAALGQDGLKQAESLVIPKALDRLNQSFDLLVVEPLLKAATGMIAPWTRMDFCILSVVMINAVSFNRQLIGLIM